MHRSVLAPRCAFFRRCLDPAFIVCPTLLVPSHSADGELQEGSGHIDLPEDDPDAVDEMLKYLYTLSDHMKGGRRAEEDEVEYEEEEEDEEVEGRKWNSYDPRKLSKELRHSTGVLLIADKYGISGLDRIAGQRIRHQLARLTTLASFAISEQDDVATWVSTLSEAMNIEMEVASMKQYRDAFAEMIATSIGFETDLLDFGWLGQKYPKLGSAILLRCIEEWKGQRFLIKEMFADLSERRKRKYRMCSLTQ